MPNIRLTDVTFADCPLPVQAVQMPDGSVGATLRSLCAALSLDYASQYQRIRRTSALRETLQSVTLDTAGGPQAVDVVPAWVIPVWLAGLHIKRLPEERRALILAFQREAVATIERAFIKAENNTSAPEAGAPQPPPPQSVWQEGHAFLDHLQGAFEGMGQEQRNLYDHLAVVQYDLHKQGRRIAALEAGQASPAGRLSDAQLGYIHRRALQAHQQIGYTVAKILAGLAEHFQVEDVSDLPEKDWPAVLEWFAGLLEEW